MSLTRAFGPDSDPRRPIFLCSRHMAILTKNLARLTPDLIARLGIDPRFDPARVRFEPAGAPSRSCQFADSEDSPCRPKRPSIRLKQG